MAKPVEPVPPAARPMLDLPPEKAMLELVQLLQKIDRGAKRLAQLSDEELAERIAAYRQPDIRYRNGVLAKYAKHVGSAAEGAVTG